MEEQVQQFIKSHTASEYGCGEIIIMKETCTSDRYNAAAAKSAHVAAAQIESELRMRLDGLPTHSLHPVSSRYIPRTYFTPSWPSIPRDSSLQLFKMYHLDGTLSPSEQTPFKDLFKIATSKWTAFKRGETATIEEPLSRPSVSRSSTQLLVPKSKT
ncbi:hypothetical protein IAQ61_007305 [Plenodomus lingam]|uniref:uncharacterized protein n=1 Tax=Leptosphaeria maculans TaxID=5022 RepID=UPI00332999FA|nr:hypothetical protein IAQ61_007305 [Plenodomus lingam]